MAIKEREYVFSITNLNRPMVFKEKRAICLLLFRLILLNPGSDPLHPDMGVGIQNYRYGMKTLEDLKKRVEEQIETYLPNFKSVSVDLVEIGDGYLNIEIGVDDTIYVYDSTEAPVPIKITDLKAS